MGCVLEPLKLAGLTGIFMATGDGSVHRNHPLLACFSGDYPEQVLMTCTKTGECPTCEIPQGKLGKFVEGENLGHQDLK